MENYTYYKDGVARVLELLKDTFGDQFKAYFNGQPDDIPESMLPCIMVSETTGSIDVDSSGTDRITENILIIVAFNKKDDVGASPDTDMTEYKLRKLVKGMNENREYLPETIMYALRTNYSMNDMVLASTIDTDFDIAQRGADIFTQEAYITLTLQRQVTLPSGRS